MLLLARTLRLSRLVYSRIGIRRALMSLKKKSRRVHRSHLLVLQTNDFLVANTAFQYPRFCNF